MALTINANNAPVFKYSIDAFSFNFDDGIVFDASSALSFTGSENASFKFSYIYPNDAEDTSIQLETSGTDTNSWSYNGLEAGPIEPEYVYASSFSDENIVYNGFALAFNEAVETVFPDRIAFSFDEYNMTIETQSDFDNFVNFAASTDELPIQSLEQGVSHLFSELHNIDVTHPITVSGQLTVGSVLNATVADWIDPDGTSTSTFDYQWLRNGNAVSNASNTAYELTDNDLGSTISVSVSYIDDGGTAEEITSFASEAVGTALIRDEHSNNAGWKFYTGTDGSDLVFGQSSTVYSSGAGDDTFVSGDDAEFQAFVGGLGTDYYNITKPGVMVVAEVNDGSTNILSASGIGFTYDTTFVLTVNDGQHLIVEDTLSDQAVWLIDWDEGGFSSSKAILADGEYTAQFIAENLSLRPNYLGDFSWSELIEMGVDIPNDMPELIADAKQWALGADTSNAEDVTINLNDDDGTLTAAELEAWVGLTGTAPAGSELTLVATLDVTGGVDEFIITTAANGDWSFTRDDINGIPYDGTYTLSLTARDTSGTISGIAFSEITFASGNIAPSDGFGTHTYSNGSVYVGEFLAGDREGQGTMTYADGMVYEGTWVDGDREGQGTITWADGTVYSGAWQDDYWSGQGTVSYPIGDVYAGEFLAGDMEGQGTYTFDDGTIYTGTSVDDLFNGQGTMTWTNGDVYVGSWVDGARTGQGTYTWADGSVYVGSWVDGDREGQGTYTGTDGRDYVGAYVDNVKEGQGTMTYADGDVYVGSWVDGDREGQGTYTQADGHVFVSEWVDGVPNGQSTVTFPYGVYIGELLNGDPNGEGIYNFKYGKVYNSVAEIGSTGDDTLIGDESSNALFGEDGNDIIEANAGDDILTGDDGDDTLNGGGGDDTLDGGDGNDALTGGSGSDAFFFQGAFGNDRITDYDSDEDILEFYASDGSALNISDLIETVNTDGNRVLSTADGLSSVTLEGTGGITPVSGGLAMSVVSQDGDVVTFGVFADPITDPDEDGIGSFDFTLNHDALDMQIDAGSLVFATGLSGLQNYDADSGTLTAGAFTLNNVEDLDAPLLTFEATMLDTKAPISIQITDIVVDGDDFASTTEVFDFSALAITTTITDRFGNAMTSAEAQAYEASNGEQFFIREDGDDDGTTVFEIVALPDANISAIDFELTDNAGLTDFTVSDALADWSVQANTSAPNTVILSGFGAIDGSENITAGQETVLATFTSATSPDFVISGIALNGVSQQNVSVDKITATSTTGNVTVFETASGSDLLIDAAMAIDTASDKAIGAFDALQALRLAVGLDKSDGSSEWHDYIAADINKDGRVGADDALNILKFAVGLTDGPSADWVFVDGDADYSAIDRKNTDYDEGVLISDVVTDLSINMTGILVGDVDGSYIA
jgi:hypothetical protein